MAKKKSGGVGEVLEYGCILTIIIFALILFAFFASGLNAIYLSMEIFHFHISRGQFWSIVVLFSTVFYFFLFFIVGKDWKSAFYAYMIINVIVIVIDLLSYFLFKLPFLAGILNMAFGI